MSRMALILTILLVGFPSHAKKHYFNSLKSYYSEFPEVKKRKCQNCHSKTSLKLNDYGQDFGSIQSDFQNIKEAFAELEMVDSDEDGVVNLEELGQGTHPGVSDQEG